MVSDYRMRLQKEVDEHLHAIAQLRFRMNSSLPISRLPPEILGYIFLQVAQWAPRHAASYEWVRRITHVCRDWRELALGTPRLWTEISSCDIDDIDRFKTFIARSKQAPLKIQLVDLYSEAMSSLIFHEVVREINRAEELSVHIADGFVETYIDHAPPSAPLLRKLNLKDVQRSSGVLFPFLKCAMPALQELTSSYPIQLDTGTLSTTLTRLCLSTETYRTEAVQFLPSTVAGAMKNLSALEYLELTNVFRPLPHRLLPPVETVVRLPNLRLIDLTGPFLSCAHFLNHCIFPASTTSIIIRTMSPHKNPNSVWSLGLPVVSSKLVSSRQADVEEGVIKSLVVSEGSLELYRASSHGPAEPALRLDVGSQKPTRGTHIVVGKILPFLPAAWNARTLTVIHFSSFTRFPSKNVWLAVPQALLNIVKLTLIGRVPGAELFDLLLWRSGTEDEAARAHPADPSSPFVLQMLEHIKLKEVSFRQSWNDADFFEGLKKALAQRDLAGSPLKEVTVKECHKIYDKKLEELRQLKTLKVKWDGQVTYGSATDDCGWLY